MRKFKQLLCLIKMKPTVAILLVSLMLIMVNTQAQKQFIQETALSQELTSIKDAQMLLDSLSILNDSQLESYRYYYTTNTKLDNGFYITHAEYCFTDDCVAIRHGLVSPSYDTLLPLFDLLLPVNENQFIFKNFETTVAFRADTSLKVVAVYDHLGFFEDYAAVGQNGKFGIIDRHGEIVVPLEYDFVESFDHLGRAVAKSGEKWVILEKNDFITPEDDIGGWGDLERMIQLIKVYYQDNWGLFDENANPVTPFKYEEVETFPGGHAAAKLEHKWGVINYDGQELTPFKYSEIVRHYTWEYTLARLNGYYGFVDSEGKEVTAFKYSQVSEDYHYDSKNGIIYFFVKERGKKYGVIDRDGAELSDMIYDRIKGCFDCHGGLKGMLNGQWVRIELK